MPSARTDHAVADVAGVHCSHALAGSAEHDEVRHAAAMKKLAERYGASVTMPAPMTFGDRSLEAFATENAVEGCILETFGALVGLAQADQALDEELRLVMRGIARDERRHGELAWEIDEPAAAGRVRAAKAQAAESLTEERPDSLDTASARILGIPVGRKRQDLANAFVASLASLEGIARAA